jgi:hypothetical protein
MLVTVTPSQGPETPLHRFRNAVSDAETPLLGRRPLVRLDHPAGSWLSHSRASHNPGRDDDFRDRHDFEGLVGRIVQTRRIHPNLVVADSFEHQDDFLREAGETAEGMLLSATWGLGSTIAQGEIVPDRIVYIS